MRISIALCTFNGARFLREQLDSLLEQERLPDEVVACDDGSTDATLAILAEFRARSPFPVLIHEGRDPVGPAKNFEKAIALCSGDLIAMCDQDDVWLPTKLRLAEAYFLEHPEHDAVFTDGFLVDSKLGDLHCRLWQKIRFTTEERAECAGGRALAVLLKHYLVTGCTLSIRAAFRPRVLPIAPLWGHDSWIGAIAAAGNRLGMIDEPTFFYRQHDSNYTGMPFKSWLDWYHETMKLPRAAYYGDEIARYRALADSLAARPDLSLPYVHELVQEKLAHLQRRAGLPAWRPARLPGIARELRRGGYARYAINWQVAIRDFLLA
jgi:glycosyltransferase involved in cell wall biosynthesis